MKRNKILFGMVLSIFSMVLVSLNPVVGYVTINENIEDKIIQTSDIDDPVQYLAIPLKYYSSFKEDIESIEDAELKESLMDIIHEWNSNSYEDIKGDTAYIPIICECIKIPLLLISGYAFLLDLFGISTPIATKLSDILYDIFLDVC